MTLKEYKQTLSDNSPHKNLSNLLAALWYDAKNNWDKAHKITQDIEGKDSAWVHAYLHRKEGDNGNASYWYSRAGKSFPDKTLEDEWEEIVSALLVKQE